VHYMRWPVGWRLFYPAAGNEPGFTAQHESSRSTGGRAGHSSGASVTWRERLLSRSGGRADEEVTPAILEIFASGGSDLRAGIPTGIPPKLL
jgi:hypothetical protein